ncbi:MAG: short-chain dehydrogenase [Betaproteobacteria bacterium RIFCSPLOWO2_12_FULL_62_13b]|nr:MAG: short-chain dehydrogenase [Betaproteobacteria bacterium RIFCSPLOWO2_12_FULL_62_13b]OGB95364.1 MAG: short-chain dehydrogenase [candidate division NC10 bacterium RIFCSPLOWO2_02_FULL_66_22]
MKRLWRDVEAKGRKECDLLVYRSNILGRDSSVTNWAGGNTSAKILEKDFRGNELRVLRVKGSGTDLQTITRAAFPGLRLDEINLLRTRRAMSDEEMVEYLAHCLVDLNAKRPSIDTLIHAFIDHAHIDHMHPDAVIAICTAKHGREIMREIYGDEAARVDWLRPGFALAKQCGELVQQNPRLKAILLGKHGLVTWGESSKECYKNTISIIEQAQHYIERNEKRKKAFGGLRYRGLSKKDRLSIVGEILPFIRGLVSKQKRTLLHYDDRPDVLEFVNSFDGKRLSRKGASCPDHLVSTKLYPMFVDVAPSEMSVENLRRALVKETEKYVKSYESYFNANRNSQDVMDDPYPRIILIPGLGMVSTGKDKRMAKISSDIYHRSIAVIRGATAIDSYVSMTPAEAFSVEYWPLERYKLTLQPKEKELSRRVAFITGAASGIGKAIAHRFAQEGAHVVIADLNATGARAVAEEIQKVHGEGKTPAIPLDVSDEENVVRAFRETVLEFGGIDIVVSNAGISAASPIDETSVESWDRQMDVLAKGYFLVSREGFRVLKSQGIGGSIIFIASKNAVASGKNASVYSAAKAAELHLARCVAEEGGALGIRVNTICPDAVIRGSSIWSGKWREERARAYGIRPDQIEEYYRNRTILKVSVFPEDVAEAALFFASDRSSKTTGAMLTVDGGVSAAFAR